MDLSDWRNEIDEIDREMMRLLRRRARVVAEIGRAKAIKKMAVIDKERERQILSRIESEEHEILSVEAARCVFLCIIEESRRIQTQIAEQQQQQVIIELC